MKIAIVDDVAQDRTDLIDTLLPFLHTFDFETELCEYSSGEIFADHFQADEFDICFLDIYMGPMDGMEIAKQIARKDPNCYIIFLTNSSDFVLQGYDVRAWRYLMKPLDYETLKKALTPCIENIILTKRYLNVKVESTEVQIPYSKILIATVSGRNVELHFMENIISLSSKVTFTQISNQLLIDQRFVLCDKGTIVNLSWIKSIENNRILMKNETYAFVSRRKLSDIKDAFLKYIMDHI